jgi:hypothetical protein
LAMADSKIQGWRRSSERSLPARSRMVFMRVLSLGEVVGYRPVAFARLRAAWHSAPFVSPALRAPPLPHCAKRHTALSPGCCRLQVGRLRGYLPCIGPREKPRLKTTFAANRRSLQTIFGSSSLCSVCYRPVIRPQLSARTG